MVTIKTEYISSYDKVQKLPPDVLWIYIKTYMNHPVGCEIYNRAIEKYPEYFNFNE